MKSKFYPEIEISENIINQTYHITIRSTLRKQGKDGLYYKWDLIRSLSGFPGDKDNTKNKCFELFTIEVYLNQMLTILPTGFTNIYGQPLYELDPNQETEIDRIKKLIP